MSKRNFPRNLLMSSVVLDFLCEDFILTNAFAMLTDIRGIEV